MSAEVVSALNAHADALDAEAETTEAQGGLPPQSPEPAPGAQAHRHPGLLRLIATEFRGLAYRMQGYPPAGPGQPATMTPDEGTVPPAP